MRFRSFAVVCVTLIVCMVSTLGYAAPVRKKLAIKAGKVITIAGPEIQDGVILVEDGTIKAVDKNVEIPWDTEVIEAKDRVVMPGFVLAHTSNGLDAPNENVPEVPFLSTFDSIDPISPFFEDSLRDGVVAMLVLPGNNTLLGGTGTVVKPYGRTVEAMLIKRYAGLKISLRPTGNTSRMGQMQRFRRYMAELKDYLEQYEQRKKDAKEMFAKAYELYSLFWGINLKLIKLDGIRSIDSGKLNSSDAGRDTVRSKLGAIVRKLIDCCVE